MHIFNVTGMTCGHCVRAVTQAIETLDPAAQVEVDLQAGKVQVISELPANVLAEAIRANGYTLQSSAH